LIIRKIDIINICELYDLDYQEKKRSFEEDFSVLYDKDKDKV